MGVVISKNMKKTLSLLTLWSFLASAAYAQAGTVKLGWDPYTSDTNVTAIRIYGIKAANATFLTNNSNATLLGSTVVTNTTLTVSNLVSGAWTFTATAYTGGTNNLESANSNTVWTNVLPGVVINLRFP